LQVKRGRGLGRRKEKEKKEKKQKGQKKEAKGVVEVPQEEPCQQAE